MKRTVLIILAALCSIALNGKAKIESYKYSDEVERSAKYSVTVDGVPVAVVPTAEPDVAIFGASGPVTVKITCLQGAPDSVIVRPIPKGYKYSLDGSVITLTLRIGDRVSVEPNHSQEKPLFIFVNPLEDKAVKAVQGKENVIFFAAGELYHIGRVSIPKGSTLYIQGGAIVEGFIQETNGYPNDITITGCGILDARKYDKNNAVRIQRAYNLKISNITVFNKNCWTTLLGECANSILDNYHVIATRTTSNKNGNENDGIDLVSCHDMTVKHCFSYAHDDAYCIKTGTFNNNGESYNIHHEDLVAWNITSGNSFEIGYSCRQDVYDITYKDLYCIHSGGRLDRFRRAGISLHQGQNAKIHDISYTNVYIEDPFEHLWSFYSFKTPYKSGQDGWTPGKIYNVNVTNLKAWSYAPCGSEIRGNDEEHKTENITFYNLEIAGKKILKYPDADIRNDENSANVKFLE